MPFLDGPCIEQAAAWDGGTVLGVWGGGAEEEHAGISEQSETTQIKSSDLCFVFFWGERVASW